MTISIESAGNGWLAFNLVTHEKRVFTIAELDAMLAQVAKWCGRDEAEDAKRVYGS